MNQTEPSTTTNGGECRPSAADVVSPAGVGRDQLDDSLENGGTDLPYSHSPASTNGSASPDRAVSGRAAVTSTAEFYGMQAYQSEVSYGSSLTLFNIRLAPTFLTSEGKARILSQARYAARVSRGSFDGLKEFPNVGLPSGVFDSYWKVDNTLQKETKLTVKEYDVCPKGCQAFTGRKEAWMPGNMNCSMCGERRVKGVSIQIDPRLGSTRVADHTHTIGSFAVQIHPHHQSAPIHVLESVPRPEADLQADQDERS